MPKDKGDWRIAIVSPNFLELQLEAERSNQRWIADFTCIWRAEGWLFVAAMIDLFSSWVIGRSMSAGMTAQMVADALPMGVRQGGCPAASLGTGQAVRAANERQRHYLVYEPIW